MSVGLNKANAMLIIFILLCSVRFSSSNQENEKLIIFMVDGIRWDYLQEDGLDGFKKIQKNGAKAEYVLPIFPSNTYPNWVAITTGLYAENHGFVNNYIYDKDENKYFDTYPTTESFWWNDAEPLWVTAEKNGIKSAVYNWDGCHLNLHDIKPSYCKRYETYMLWPTVNEDTMKAVLNILDLFEKDYRLGLVYYEPVDGYGHRFGPDSKMRKKALKNIDNILNNLQDELDKRGLSGSVNIIVVSDHGMSKLTFGKTKTINIGKAVSLNDVKVMLDVECMSMLWPEEGKEDQVYNDLKNANIEGLIVYRKEDVPEIFHFRHHRRIAPIILVTKSPDYIITPLQNVNKMKPFYILGELTPLFVPGVHGCNQYKVEDMRAIFAARGPSFEKNYTSPPLHMVDHYNIFCSVLGIQPLPNNGSWERVKDMLSLKNEKQK